MPRSFSSRNASKKSKGGKSRARTIEPLGEPLVLYEFSEIINKSQISSALRSAGLSRSALEVEKKINRVEKKLINELVKIAIAEVQETIPIDSGELRADHIEFTTASVGDNTAVVEIDTESHTQYGRTASVEAAGLAAWLNVHVASDTARAVGRREGKRPVANWIQRSHKGFKSKSREALAKVLRSG